MKTKYWFYLTAVSVGLFSRFHLLRDSFSSPLNLMRLRQTRMKISFLPMLRARSMRTAGRMQSHYWIRLSISMAGALMALSTGKPM